MAKTKTLTKRVIEDFLVPHSRAFTKAIILMIIIALTSALLAWLIEPAVNLMFDKESSSKYLYIVPVAVFVVTLIKTTSTYFQTLIMSITSAQISADMRYRLYSHFIGADLKLFDRINSSNAISNITNDINLLMITITGVLTGFIRQLLTVIALMGVMAYENWQLALISLIGLPIAAAPIAIITRKLKKLTRSNQQELEGFTSQIDDSLRAIRLVKAYNAESFETKRMKGLIDSLFKYARKIAKTSLLASPFVEAVSAIGIAFVIFYGGYEVRNGNSTPGEFFAFFTAMIMAYKPLKSLAGINNLYQQGKVAAERIYNILDTEPKILSGKKKIEKVKGNIEFKKATFGYNEDLSAIDGLTAKFEAAKRTALVGYSGSGKSTIINLILRFYDVTDGKITLDGTDIKELDTQSLRAQFSLVSQDIQLFDDSVMENIRYSNTDKSDDEVMKAAKLAEAHEFIEELEEGYKTKIGQNGNKLSGGQRQRLSIARAILADSPILLLDEATSALDNKSEAKVKKALDSLMEGKTTIVIAHRLSTIENADNIIVLDKGKLVEQGTHKELIKKNGAYAKLKG